MKNLDLNNCGVQEMNAGEMRENNGGMLVISDWWMFFRIGNNSWGWGSGSGSGTVYA
jgi:hypothetical protein